MVKMTRSNYTYDNKGLMVRNTLSFIVRDGDYKEGILRPNSMLGTIENFCNVILSSEENWNNMASYSGALLQSKKLGLDERIRTFRHLLAYYCAIRAWI